MKEKATAGGKGGKELSKHTNKQFLYLYSAKINT